jgi:hypothetical protein
MTAVELREPTDAELRRIYAAEAEHVLATVDGEAAAWIAFKTIDGRTWGMFGVCGVRLLRQRGDDCSTSFARICGQSESESTSLPCDQAAERLLRLVGLIPTFECFGDKRVWAWTQDISSS